MSRTHLATFHNPKSRTWMRRRRTTSKRLCEEAVILRLLQLELPRRKECLRTGTGTRRDRDTNSDGHTVAQTKAQTRGTTQNRQQGILQTHTATSSRRHFQNRDVDPRRPPMEICASKSWWRAQALFPPQHTRLDVLGNGPQVFVHFFNPHGGVCRECRVCGGTVWCKDNAPAARSGA